MGAVQIKLGFVTPPHSGTLLDFDEIFSELVRRSRPSLVSAPPVRLTPAITLFCPRN